MCWTTRRQRPHGGGRRWPPPRRQSCPGTRGSSWPRPRSGGPGVTAAILPSGQIDAAAAAYARQRRALCDRVHVLDWRILVDDSTCKACTGGRVTGTTIISSLSCPRGPRLVGGGVDGWQRQQLAVHVGRAALGHADDGEGGQAAPRAGGAAEAGAGQPGLQRAQLGEDVWRGGAHLRRAASLEVCLADTWALDSDGRPRGREQSILSATQRAMPHAHVMGKSQ